MPCGRHIYTPVSIPKLYGRYLYRLITFYTAPEAQNVCCGRRICEYQTRRHHYDWQLCFIPFPDSTHHHDARIQKLKQERSIHRSTSKPGGTPRILIPCAAIATCTSRILSPACSCSTQAYDQPYWDWWLPILEHTYNDSKHSTTGRTPFYTDLGTWSFRCADALQRIIRSGLCRWIGKEAWRNM